MERNIYYPLQVPSAPTGQISTWKHRFRVESTYAAGRRGSNVYEVNLWLWQIGRGKPLFGGFRWQTQRTVELSSRQTVLGVLLRRASAALREVCKMTWH